MTTAWDTILSMAGGGTAFPDGEYTVKLVKAKAGTTYGGKQKFTLTFQDSKGRSFQSDQVVSPESQPAMEYFYRRMEILGAYAHYFAMHPTPEAVADTIVSNQLYQVRIEHSQFRDRDYIEIKSIRRV